MPDTALPFDETIAALRLESGANPLAHPACAVLVWSLDPQRLVWHAPDSGALAVRLADPEGVPREGVAQALGLDAAAARATLSSYRLHRVRLGVDRFGAPSIVAFRRLGRELDGTLLTAFPGGASPASAASSAPVAAEEPDEPIAGSVAASERDRAADGVDEAAVVQEASVPDREGRRFVFRTDEGGRFTFVSRELDGIVGPVSSDILGRRWRDLAGRVVLDTGGGIDEGFDQFRSWTRRPILWRDRTGEGGIPGELSGSPILRVEGGLDGFRGFGVLFASEARALRPYTFADVLPPPEESPQARSGPLGHALEAAAALTGSAGETMLDVLKAFFAQVGDVQNAPDGGGPARRDGVAGSIVPATPVETRPIETAPTLSPQEHGAFEEIARALGTGGELPGPQGPDADLAPAASLHPPTDESARLLDSMPLGVATVREGVPVFANRWLLDRLGCDDLPALAAAGGLGVVAGDLIDRAEAASGASVAGEMGSLAGSSPEVEARMAPASWGGLPASLLVVTPASGRRLAALESEAVQRDRSARELALALGLAADFAITLDAGGWITGLPVVPARSLGLAKVDLVGLPLTAFVPAEDHPAVASGLDAARAGGLGAATSRELRLMGRDGKTVPALMRIALISEVPASYALVFHDLSRIRALEEEARTLQARMLRVGVEQSDFLRRVSHDIRTPLTAINGFAELMLDERVGEIQGERARGYIRDIRESGHQIGALLDDLVDLARADAGQAGLDRANLDLNEVTRAALSEAGQSAAHERTIVRTSYAPGLAPVRADRDTILRAIRNVMASAISLAGAGGQLIVSTLAGRQGEIVLSVRSTGACLSPDEIEAVMTPFRAAPPIRPSRQTGLALPLSRALVQANGGRFAITTDPGRGTLVELRFQASATLQGAIAAE